MAEADYTYKDIIIEHHKHDLTYRDWETYFLR